MESAQSKEAATDPLLRQLPSWGLFLAGVAAVAYAQWLWGAHRFEPGLRWMVLGIACAAAAALYAPLRARADAEAAPPRLSAAEIGFLAAVTVAAGVVRFTGLDHLPPGGFFDEVEYHRFAEAILAGYRPIFIPDIQLPALFVYLLAGAIAVAGRGLATVRGVAALLGTLTIPVFYLLARRAFARPVAAAGAILLAGSRWHITFSRVVFSAAITGPLLETLAVLLFWRAAQKGRRLDYVFLGIVFGLGLQTYYSFNLFPLVLAVAMVSYAARQGRGRFWPELGKMAKGLAWSVGVAAILLFPLARFAARNPGVFFARSGDVVLWNPAHNLPWPGALWQSIGTHLLMFNYRGDYNPRHNIPDEPLLNPIEGVLLALGLGLAIARGRRWPQATWLAWFVAMLLPAILTIEAPQAHRAVGAIPAVYLLLAEALQGIHTLTTAGARRPRRAVAAALLIAVSLAAASQGVWRYFRVQSRHPKVWAAFQAEYHEIAKFIKPFAGRYDIRVNSVYYDYPILRFHLGDDFPYGRFRSTDSLPVSSLPYGNRSEGTLFVLEPIQRELFPLFQELYPHARLEDHLDPFGQSMFASVLVPRADLENPADRQAAQRGWLGAYYSNDQWQGTPDIVRREPAVLFHFHWDQEALGGNFTADWAANLRIERSGAYAFDLETSGPSLVQVDGQTLFSTENLDSYLARSGVVELSEGEHRLVVRYLRKGFLSNIRLFWRPPSESRSVIPLRLLRPLDRKDYFALRERLPVPRAQ